MAQKPNKSKILKVAGIIAAIVSMAVFGFLEIPKFLDFMGFTDSYYESAEEKIPYCSRFVPREWEERLGDIFVAAEGEAYYRTFEARGWTGIHYYYGYRGWWIEATCELAGG